MLIFPGASANEGVLQGTATSESSPERLEIEREVISMFDEYRDPILRYVLSCGIYMHDAEEIAQEVFLALFRHLRLGRGRQNLRGWLFRVAHNLAVKRRYVNLRSGARVESDWSIVENRVDPAPNPEEQASSSQQHRRVMDIFCVLPEQDRLCLQLRAEGLRYREIAAAVGISLGAVSISLARSLARFIRANGT